MKVSELIALLEDCNPEAEVVLMTQPNYPLEHELGGVTTRGDLFGDDDLEEDIALASQDPDTVILVEGASRGYGQQEAWETAVRS